MTTSANAQPCSEDLQAGTFRLYRPVLDAAHLLHRLYCMIPTSHYGTRSPIHLLSLLSSSPQLRCRSPSVASVGGGGDWELHSSGNADDALDVNEYLMDDIYDCSSAVGIAATEGGSLLSSWWGAAAAAVSSTVANVAAQPLVESNILHFLQSDDSR